MKVFYKLLYLNENPPSPGTYWRYQRSVSYLMLIILSQICYSIMSKKIKGFFKRFQKDWIVGFFFKWVIPDFAIVGQLEFFRNITQFWTKMVRKLKVCKTRLRQKILCRRKIIITQSMPCNACNKNEGWVEKKWPHLVSADKVSFRESFTAPFDMTDDKSNPNLKHGTLFFKIGKSLWKLFTLTHGYWFDWFCWIFVSYVK